MKRALLIGAASAALLAPASADADARPAVCGKHPVLATVQGAGDRANKGWNAREVKTNEEAIRRVRIQRRCAPSKKGRRHVREAIDHARHKYQRAVAAQESEWPTPEEVGVSTSTLYAIRDCESGGDYTAISPDGTYRGGFQFDYATWASVGGAGDPAGASPAEQDYRAALLYRQSGASPWPVCGS